MAGSRTDDGLFGVLRREVGLDVPFEVDGEPDRGPARVVASAVIVVTGVVLLLPNITLLLTAPMTLVGTLLSLLGTVVSVGLVAGGYSLYHSRFSDSNAERIAAWNVVGLVLVGLVLLGMFSYQESAGVVVVEPTFTITNLLAIGVAAHVIVGVYDARRVRAEALAVERGKLAALNRVLRDSVRTEAAVLLGHTETISEHAETDDVRDTADTLSRQTDRLGELTDEAATVMNVYDRHGTGIEEHSLRDDTEAAVEAVRAAHPDTQIRMDVSRLAVQADPALPDAIEELVENGVVHSEADEPRVEVRAAEEERWIALEIRDYGPGMPEDEYQVVTGDSEITQLTTDSGLGLWVAQAVVDASNGRLDLGVPDEEGTVVTLRLPPA
ncbi:MAG: ATP-binding protein [Halolamina sp.]|uniref:sensor histidine kinase n=1 Tax=Halolamina sp. TaxID=1940283 RepID=UPI002FC32C79